MDTPPRDAERYGVLWSTMNYVIAAHSHPPCDLLSSLFTKRLARWRHLGGGIPTWRSTL